MDRKEILCDDGEIRQVISRSEALEQGLKRYFSGRPCKQGHVNERKVNSYACIICNREHVKRRNKYRMKHDQEYKKKVAQKRRAQYHKKGGYRVKPVPEAELEQQESILA